MIQSYSAASLSIFYSLVISLNLKMSDRNFLFELRAPREPNHLQRRRTGTQLRTEAPVLKRTPTRSSLSKRESIR